MRNKIVLIPLPFDDFSQTKVRPAACLTNQTGSFQHIVVAFITSQEPHDSLPSDIELQSNEVTGLKVKSFLRLHKITTIPFSLINRELGEVPNQVQSEITSQLKLLFHF